MLGIKASAVGNAHYFSKSAVAGKHLKAKHLADLTLAEIKRIFYLGSSNTSPSTYSPHRDGYNIFPGKISKNHTLEALIDFDVQQLAKQRIAISRQKVQQLISTTEEMPAKSRRRMVRSTTATLAAATGAGNCEELSTFAFLQLLAKNERDFSLECVVFNEPLDHTFLILNRDYSTDIKHWQTWNPTAIILDPWLGFHYSPTEFARVWQHNERGMPPHSISISRKFDAEEFLAPDRPEGRISH